MGSVSMVPELGGFSPELLSSPSFHPAMQKSVGLLAPFEFVKRTAQSNQRLMMSYMGFVMVMNEYLKSLDAEAKVRHMKLLDLKDTSALLSSCLASTVPIKDDGPSLGQAFLVLSSFWGGPDRYIAELNSFLTHQVAAQSARLAEIGVL